jgi:hypothetical protein
MAAGCAGRAVVRGRPRAQVVWFGVKAVAVAGGGIEKGGVSF